MCWATVGRPEKWSPPQCLCQHLRQIHWSPFCCWVVQTISLHLLGTCISVARSSWCCLSAVEDKPKYCCLIPGDTNPPFRSVAVKVLQVQIFASVWDSELDLKEVCTWMCLRSSNRAFVRAKDYTKCRMEPQYYHVQGFPYHGSVSVCVEQGFVLQSWVWQSSAFACFLCWTLSTGLKPGSYEKDKVMTNCVTMGDPLSISHSHLLY